jgi:hypothetical protein
MRQSGVRTEANEETRAVTRAWPLETVINAAFDGLGLRARLRFQLGLRRIENYVHAAEVQVVRVDAQMTKYLDGIKAEPPGMVEYPSGQLVADAHFYFICWDSVAKELGSLRSNAAGLRAPREAWRRYRTSLTKYMKARDHLEHYSERLPLGKRSTWIYQSDDTIERISGDPGAVRLGSVFTLNGDQWDVSLESAKILSSLWQDLDEGIRAETDTMFAAWLRGDRSTKRS